MYEHRRRQLLTRVQSISNWPHGLHSWFYGHGTALEAGDVRLSVYVLSFMSVENRSHLTVMGLHTLFRTSVSIHS